MKLRKGLAIILSPAEQQPCVKDELLDALLESRRSRKKPKHPLNLPVNDVPYSELNPHTESTS
jgi:hypothetical protein